MEEKAVAKRDIEQMISHFKEVEKVIAKCGGKAAEGVNVLERGLRHSKGVQLLRNLLDDDVMHGIMELQDHPLGFMTDRAGVDKGGRKKTPYSMDVVRDATIEGLLRGIYPVDNQMNILAKRCYITKTGFRHKVKEIEGLTDLNPFLRVPRVTPGEVVVEASATWKINGKPWKIETYEIPVKVYDGQGSDLALGKADRRLHKRIFEFITGSYEPDGEFDPVDDAQGEIIDVDPNPVTDIQDRVAEANKATAKGAEVPPDQAPEKEPEKPAHDPVDAPVAGSRIPDDVFEKMGIAPKHRGLAEIAWLLAMGDDTAPNWTSAKFLEVYFEHMRKPDHGPLKGLDALTAILEGEIEKKEKGAAK